MHSVFAGYVRTSGLEQSLIKCFSLALMTYYGIVLLLAGYQADEAHIVKQDRAIVEQYVVLIRTNIICLVSFQCFISLP